MQTDSHSRRHARQHAAHARTCASWLGAAGRAVCVAQRLKNSSVGCQNTTSSYTSDTTCAARRGWLATSAAGAPQRCLLARVHHDTTTP